MAFRYVQLSGIIDDFQFSMTADDFIANALKTYEFGRPNKSDYIKGLIDEIDIMLDQIDQFLLNSDEHDKPHTVRFFGVPDFSGFGFVIMAVAKIINNGQTYLFGNDKKLMIGIAGNGWGGSIGTIEKL